MSRAQQIVRRILEAAAMNTPPPAHVWHAPVLPHQFIKALNMVEASGKHSNVHPGDNGSAIGPFQIHRKYWEDSGVAGNWEECNNYEYAVKVVEAYMHRYGGHFIATGDWESLARIHNGGPHGYKDPSTDDYAEKFNTALQNIL
jgi:hypothetical protein